MYLCAYMCVYFYIDTNIVTFKKYDCLSYINTTQISKIKIFIFRFFFSLIY